MAQTELWTRTALVVEDDEVMARLLQFLLESEGYTVHCVPDGLTARKYIQNEVAPDLVTLDFMLPDATGIDLLNTIRVTPDWRHVPVLLLTAESLVLVELAAPPDDIGKTSFMEKPFKTAELRAHVSRLVNESTLQRVAAARCPRRAGAGRRH
jgi:DNA-binding response OmpR family regulator